MYELNKSSKCNYKSIYLDTRNCVANPERNIFVFNKLPLIQVKGDKNIIRVKSVSLTGAGSFTNHTWTVKLNNVKYNQQMYYNSDLDATPTLLNFKDDSVNAYNHGGVLEIDKQDINNLTLEVCGFDSTTTKHGLFKSSQVIDMWLNIVIEEYYD